MVNYSIRHALSAPLSNARFVSFSDHVTSFSFKILTRSIFFECILKGKRSFILTGVCRFCYQTPEWMHVCTPMTSCKKSSWVRLHKVNCTVQDNVVCLGNRAFNKRIECNWTSGYSWNVTMILSVLLGGFGIDRFYLGLIKVRKSLSNRLK